jgi:bifunctional UDP-N-acetylglucosamine pyrophosphorylase/glucosamine-1-phosphate N-acetyltransferase
MKSDLLKVMHPVGGEPMIKHVVRTAQKIGAQKPIVVIGHQRETVKKFLGDEVEYAVQEEQLGTGHALLQAVPLLLSRLQSGDDSDLVVLYGDTPLITVETLDELINTHRGTQSAATVLSTEVDHPKGYGRILRDERGDLSQIVEEADATESQREIREINTGIYVFAARTVLNALTKLKSENVQGEYYLPDVFPILKGAGHRVTVHKTSRLDDVMGINDRVQQAAADKILRDRVRRHWLSEGVTLVDPETIYIDTSVSIGKDTTIMPFTFLAGKTIIGEGCRIGPNAHISDSIIGDHVLIGQSVIEESRIASDVVVGPFNHIRPNTSIAQGVKVGNFAEIKNSQIGPNSKVPHHSYIGDTTIGANVNIGAGVVTVNYDGKKKNHTDIEDNAFVGCNANLVAPVRVGRGSYIAAGSTINRDVPAGSLAIARERQSNKEGWVEKKSLGKKD